MIRQIITCDICGAQKREANHWFIAREEAGEIRISGWNAPHTFSPQARHLCGETCVHKLISQDLMKLAVVDIQSIHETVPFAKTTVSAAPATERPASSMRQDSRIAPEAADYSRLERSFACTGRRAS